MAVVISNDVTPEHNVDQYHFKVLSVDDETTSNENSSSKENLSADAHTNLQQRAIDASALPSETKDSLIESLIQKTEEMSANFAKLQAKIEARDAEYSMELQNAKDLAFKEGYEKGIAECKTSVENQFHNSIEQFSHSIAKMDQQAKTFSISLKKIEDELVIAALDIAKEVVNAEITKNSQEVALSLAKELIAELQTASKIVLHVNPKDYNYLTQKLADLEKVELKADTAVLEGGVIAMSDSGNIDAQIIKRFEKVKKVVLSE